MRQVVGLIKVIRKNQTIDFYNELLVHSIVHQVKIPSLSEFLGANSNQDEDTSVFTEDIDRALEKEAIRQLEERRKSLGK